MESYDDVLRYLLGGQNFLPLDLADWLVFS